MSTITGIVYGLKEGRNLDLLRPYVSSLLQFTQKVIDTPEPYFDTNLYKLAVALIGDLSSSFGADLSRYLVDSTLIKGIKARLDQLEAAQDPGLEDCKQRVVWLNSTLKTVYTSDLTLVSPHLGDLPLDNIFRYSS